MALCPDGHQSVATDYCDECGLAIGAAAPVTVTGGMTLATSSSRPGDPCPNCLLPREQGDPFCEGCGFDFARESAYPTEPHPLLSFDPDPAPVNGGKGAATGTGVPLMTGETGGFSGTAGGGTTGFPGPATTTNGVAPQPPAPSPIPGTGRWTVVVNADREYYDSVVAEGEIDPATYPFPPFCPERRFTLTGDVQRVGRSSATRGAVEIDLTGPPTDPGVSHLHAVFQARPDGGWTVLDPGSTNGTVLNDDTAPIPANQAVPVEPGFRIHVGVWTTLTLVVEP